MKTDELVSAIVAVIGLILLCAGIDNSEYATAGAVLIGSWFIARNLPNSKT